jgi:hypothetical protein
MRVITWYGSIPPGLNYPDSSLIPPATLAAPTSIYPNKLSQRRASYPEPGACPPLAGCSVKVVGIIEPPDHGDGPGDADPLSDLPEFQAVPTVGEQVRIACTHRSIRGFFPHSFTRPIGAGRKDGRAREARGEAMSGEIMSGEAMRCGGLVTWGCRPGQPPDIYMNLFRDLPDIRYDWSHLENTGSVSRDNSAMEMQSWGRSTLKLLYVRHS